MLKGTKLYSIFKNRCPHCQEGHFFLLDNPYKKLGQFDKQHKHCKVCNENFEREVGFYYGAMYVNYGITVILGLIWFSLFYFFIGFSAMIFLLSFSALLLVLLPWVFRTGRLLWINLFVKYDPAHGKK